MKKILYLLLTLFCITILTPAVPVIADLGDFNDYDYDSGSDWDYGGGSDWDYDSGSGSYYVYGGGGHGGGGLSPLAVITVIIIVIIVLYFNKRGGGPSGGSTPSSGSSGGNITVNDNTEKIVEEIHKIDPDYSNDKFIGWVKEVFFTLQNAWSERDFAKARPFEKEELYRQHEMQIKKYIENNRINVLDRINVNQAYLYKYVRDNEYEYLTVYIQCRMVDYIKDATTGQILKGDPNRDCHLRYLYTFMRKKGVTTNPATSNKSVVACPHCGAPTSITSAGKCEYCGFIVTTGEFDWVLSNIEAVKNGVNIDNGGVIIRDNKMPD